MLEQEFMLTQQFTMMKIKGVSQKAQEAKLTQREIDALDKINPMVRDLTKGDAVKINDGITKQLTDPKVVAYSKLIDGFLKSALK
jgi:hypothetical protein